MDNKNGKRNSNNKITETQPQNPKTHQQNNPIQSETKNKKLSNQTQTQTQNKPTQFKPKKIIKKTKK